MIGSLAGVLGLTSGFSTDGLESSLNLAWEEMPVSKGEGLMNGVRKYLES